MSSLRTLHLHLGLRFGTGNDRRIGDQASEFLEEIERLERKNPIPLFWNFPVAPVLEKRNRRTESLMASIGRRVREGEDRVIPAGFGGAPHPLLLREELRRELLWCYRNPWFPALKDLFDEQPEVILPVYPDLYSEATGGAYSVQGFTTIGIPIALYRLYPPHGKHRWTKLRPLAAAEHRIRGVDTEVKLQPVVVLQPGEVRPESIEVLLAACGRADRIFLMLDLSAENPGSDSPEPASLNRLFRLLSGNRRIRCQPFSTGTRNSSPPTVDPAEMLKFVAPTESYGTARAWDQIEKLRQKKRKSNLQMGDLLKTIASVARSTATPRPGQTDREQTDTIEITNIAMAGSVTLIGTGLQATFSQGRLSNLIDHGDKVLPGEPGRSVFTIDNKQVLLKTDSAFSFDREGQSGLRSILSSHVNRGDEGVQVVLDYYFADECGFLALDIAVRYPSLPSGVIQEATPLELCLCSFSEDDRPEIEVQASGRDPFNHTLPAGPQVFLLAGQRFRLQYGKRDVELQVLPFRKTASGKIEFRVEKKRRLPRGTTAARGRTLLLWANLGGSYLPQPAANLSTRRLHISYGIRFSGAPGRGKRR